MANTARLVIDPITRKISTKYEKIRLAKNDNNSMRITFEMPRYVRGHDMSNCSTIEVHYDNISIDRKQKHSDVYVVTDIIVAPEDDETINFSWLVSRGATQIVGNVDFSLHFGCNEDPDLEYAWHTTTYSGIVVLESKHNTQSVVEKHPDLVASILDYVDKKISEFDAVDIAQETGDSTEAVMSQKATTDALAGKVDKVDAKRIVYGTGNNGEPVQRYISQTPSTNAVPQYSSDGRLQTNAPAEDLDVANMEFVKDRVAKKVNAQFFFGGKNRLYCARPNDPNSYREIDSKPWLDCIPVYTDVESNIAPSASVYGQATIVVVDPKHPYQAANKRYVEGKVDPIKEDVELLKDLSAGVLYDIETVESTDNPVTVPSNALPAATIDKIGCGLIADENRIINEAVIRGSSLPSYVEEVVDANTCTFKVADGTYIGFDEEILCTPNGGYINDQDTYYFKAEVVSGSFTPSDSNTEFCVVDQGNLITVGDPATKLSTSWSYGDVIPLSLFIQGSGSITCTDLVLRVTWGRKLESTGVPVTAVMLNSATVYTVPEQIRALKVRVDEGAGFQNAYGLALSETLYNYLDLENKQYVINCAVGSHPHGGLWTVEHHEIIDVSAYLTDEDGEITVSAGDRISFCDNDGILVPYDVPNAITYYIKKGV